uniref:Uncharacterized protein n=1 Tax=Panagrolaimus sp. JU765 TaxID=591449 RepID=A0AC34PW86_9BILA
MDYIRQCTCSEEVQCTTEMKSQAMSCLEPCWDKFGAVTKNPEKLKNCFTEKRNFMDLFLSCFEENLQGCSEEFTSQTIPKISLATYFQRAVSRFNNTRNLLVDSLGPIRRILNSSKGFARCVNKCFLDQNADGFCFDKKNCQPLITDFNAQRALRKCTRKMNWKQEAGSVCDCVVDSDTDLIRMNAQQNSELLGEKIANINIEVKPGERVIPEIDSPLLARARGWPKRPKAKFNGHFPYKKIESPFKTKNKQNVSTCSNAFVKYAVYYKRYQEALKQFLEQKNRPPIDFTTLIQRFIWECNVNDDPDEYFKKILEYFRMFEITDMVIFSNQYRLDFISFLRVVA